MTTAVATQPPRPKTVTDLAELAAAAAEAVKWHGGVMAFQENKREES